MRDVISLKKKQLQLLHKVEKIENIVKIWCYKYFMRKKYIKKSDFISKEYKNQIRDFFAPYCKRRGSDFLWHKFYSSRNQICDPRYISDDIFCRQIVPFLNNKEVGVAYADKNFLNKLFPNVLQPICIVRKMNGEFFDSNYSFITEEEALVMCKKYNELVIKPAMGSSGGSGVRFVDKGELSDLNKIFYEYKDDFIIQLPIKQSKEMKMLNPSSVNTIRILSLYWKGETKIVSSVVRMGNVGCRVDNISAGGFSCGIDQNGKLKKVAFSATGEKIFKHPNGFGFNRFCIPEINEIYRLVKESAQQIPYERIISWDICLDEKNFPILIEINTLGQEIILHQLNNGALFGNETKEILDYVYEV